MYAIVEIAGQQFKVERGNKLYVHRLEANEGAGIEFDRVLLLGNGDKVTVGSPLVEGAKVAATIIGHVKGDKVIVFKKKRRKGYQKWNNHRQQYTQVLIQGVLGKGEKLKEEELKAEKKVWIQGNPRKNDQAPAEVKAETSPEVKHEAEAPVKKKPATKRAPKKKQEEK
jgi:large subunit ribosomal protein L21